MPRQATMLPAILLVLLLANSSGAVPRAADVAARRVTSRIANGTLATAGQFPWAAALYRTSPVNEKRTLFHYCGGTLVAKDAILTAAHCVSLSGAVDPPAYVRVGMVDALNETAPRRVPAKVFVHPYYNEDTIAYDVAIIQLRRPIRKIAPVLLANNTMNLTVGETLVTLGFGETPTQDLSRELLYTSISYVSREQCNAYYISFSGQGIPSTSICAGSKGSNDSCPGDSGGALINSEGVQVGIVSFGPSGCGDKGHIGAYTGIASVRRWINMKLREIRNNPAIPPP